MNLCVDVIANLSEVDHFFLMLGKVSAVVICVAIIALMAYQAVEWISGEQHE